MGNYRFRISDIIPICWFNHKPKPKKQSITTSSLSSSSCSPLSSFAQTKPHQEDHQRKSYYFSRDLTLLRHEDPPRKSSKKRRPTNNNNKPLHQKTVSGQLNSQESACPSSESGSAQESFCFPSKTNSSTDDILRKVDLRPIITKPKKVGSSKWVIDDGGKALAVKVLKEGITRSPVRRIPGGKVRGNGYSPRVRSRVRLQAINGGRRSTGNRRSLSESMAVIKTSVDPYRDFKESMVEMIMENNMKSSKELEDLLACYLSLNSDEYHDLIIKVFKQIWFESTHIRL